MNPKVYVIVFRLNAGHSVQVNTEEVVAKDFFRKWLHGKLEPIIGETNVAGPWAIRSSDIMVMQLFDADELAKMQTSTGTRPQQPMGGWLGAGSGRN